MKNTRTWIIASALTGALALLVTQSALARGNTPAVGKAVPSFTMTDLKGKKHTPATLKGKVVLLDFWASWCGPCKAASPSMQKLHAAYAKKGLVVIGANTFERGEAKKNAASKYAKAHKYTYTFTVNNDALAQSWGIDGVPMFILIDKKGTVQWVQNGWDDSLYGEAENKIKAALAAK